MSRSAVTALMRSATRTAFLLPNMAIHKNDTINPFHKMARPTKTGLSYFPFDVDFFNDEKVVCIAGEFGIKGEITTIKLLCAIYRNGYFIEWNEKFQLALLRQLQNISLELLNQIVNRLVKWGFFDASLFDSAKVLTSVEIQRTYFAAVKKRVKAPKHPFLLVSSSETPVSASETPVSASETQQIKEKKNKLNKKKSSNEDAKKGVGVDFPDLERVKEYFISIRANERLKDWETLAQLFFDTYDSANWRGTDGNPIWSWKALAYNWVTRRQNEQKINAYGTTAEISTNSQSAEQRNEEFRQHIIEKLNTPYTEPDINCFF